MPTHRTVAATAAAGGRSALVNPDAGTSGRPETRLYSEGAFRGLDRPVLAPLGSPARRIAGTPYLDPRSAQLAGAATPPPEAVEAARARLAAAHRHTGRWAGRWTDMARTALLDLDALTLPNGAVLAAASPYWSFVWPRDNGVVAVALGLCGRHHDAWAALRYVFSVQEDDGGWQARYLPDGSGDVPDGRGRQDDGIGFTLWATWVVTQLSPPALTAHRLPALRDGVLRAVAAAGDVLDDVSGAVSQDYWETDLPEPSLGVAAPLLVGLRAGGELADTLGDASTATAARARATALRTAIAATYGPHGFQRLPSGGGLDASTALLLPPFVAADDVLPGAADAWAASMTAMRVDNGGLRPGEAWPDTTTAWTPQVSLYAVVAAATGRRRTAGALLDWLDAHRTALGCLPEKVTGDGRPAAVAPIAVVAAAVLIALAVLDGHTLPAPTGRERTEGTGPGPQTHARPAHDTGGGRA